MTAEPSSLLDRLGRVLVMDSRRSESLHVFIPAYFLAVLFLLPTVTVLESKPSFAAATECQTIHNCARLFTPLVYDVVRLLTNATMYLFDSSDPYHTKAIAPKLPHLTAYIIDYLKRLVLLSPLLPLLCLATRRVIYGLFFLFVFVLVSSGWGVFQPFMKDELLDFVLPGQYHRFWEFGRIQLLLSHDLFAFAFMAVVVLVLAFRKNTTLHIAALAAFGQAAYEHLGFITGVGAALFMFVTTDGPMAARARKALNVLFACGVASVIVVVLILVRMYVLHDAIGLGYQDEATRSENFFRFAKDNINNYRYLLFRAAYFHFFPAALCLVSGIAFGLLDPLDDEWRERALRASLAAAAVLSAFFLAAAIGFFTIITYASEMAREFYGFVHVLAFLSLATGMLIGTSARKRFSPGT